MSESIYHYGVKGMKWGVRKKESRERVAREKGGRRSLIRNVRPSRPSSSDHSTVSELRKKRVTEMTNDDLKRINERLQLEKSYSELTASSGNYKKGKKIVKEILDTTKMMNDVYNTVDNSPFKKAFNR